MRNDGKFMVLRYSWQSRSPSPLRKKWKSKCFTLQRIHYFHSFFIIVFGVCLCSVLLQTCAFAYVFFFCVYENCFVVNAWNRFAARACCHFVFVCNFLASSSEFISSCFNKTILIEMNINQNNEINKSFKRNTQFWQTFVLAFGWRCDNVCVCE